MNQTLGEALFIFTHHELKQSKVIIFVMPNKCTLHKKYRIMEAVVVEN